MNSDYYNNDKQYSDSHSFRLDEQSFQKATTDIAENQDGQEQIPGSQNFCSDTTARAMIADIGISPKSYGAIGDANYFNDSNKQWYSDASFTTLAYDDTLAFRQALSVSVNGVLHITKGQGQYYLIEHLDVPSNTTIILEDGVKLAIKSFSECGLKIANKDNVNIIGRQNVEIRMYKQPNTVSPYQHAIYILSSKNVLIEGLSIYTSDGDGIDIGGGRSNLPNENIKISSCKIFESKRNNISVTHAQNILIENCILNDCHDSAPQSGIDIEPNAGCIAKNILVKNCTAKGNLGTAFCVTNQSEAIEFHNCKSYNNGTGFLGSGVRASIYATNLKYFDCVSDNTTGEGFSFDKTKNILLENCIAVTCSNGFAVYSKTKECKLINCKAQSNRAAGFIIRDISGFLTTEDVTLFGCVSDSCGSNGFTIQNCTSASMVNCISRLNATDGVQIRSTVDCSVKGCKILNNIGCGIAEYSNTDLLVSSGNEVLRNKKCGILVYDSIRTLIKDNVIRDNCAFEDSQYKANIRVQQGVGASITGNVIRSINSNGVNIVGISVNQYNLVKNSYFKDNDCFQGGSGKAAGLLLVSGDSNNNINAGNRNKDGTYGTTAN